MQRPTFIHEQSVKLCKRYNEVLHSNFVQSTIDLYGFSDADRTGCSNIDVSHLDIVCFSDQIPYVGLSRSNLLFAGSSAEAEYRSLVLLLSKSCGLHLFFVILIFV